MFVKALRTALDIHFISFHDYVVLLGLETPSDNHCQYVNMNGDSLKCLSWHSFYILWNV